MNKISLKCIVKETLKVKGLRKKFSFFLFSKVSARSNMSLMAEEQPKFVSISINFSQINNESNWGTT